MIAREVIVNEFRFNMVAGALFGEANGVVIELPMLLDDPDYLKALARALEIYPCFRAIVVVHGSFASINPRQADDETLDNLLRLCAQVLNFTGEEFPGDWIAETRKTYETLEDEWRHRNRQMGNAVEPKQGAVYLLATSLGHYKIGWATNVQKRLSNFSVKLPFQVELVCQIETLNPRTLETELHKRFSDKRLNGEWFLLTSEDVSYIKSLAVGD